LLLLWWWIGRSNWGRLIGRGSEHIAEWFPVGGTIGSAHVRRRESTFIEEVADLFFCVWAVLLFVFVDVYLIHGWLCCWEKCGLGLSFVEQYLLVSPREVISPR
jgi:hypothetical protein